MIYILSHQGRRAAAVFLVCALVFSPYPVLLNAQSTAKGILIGHIFAKDGTTPVMGAVVSIKNVSTGLVYTSTLTDIRGAFRIENIDKGIYQYGIATPEGHFNSESFIGIQENKTTKVTIALSLFDSKTAQAVDEIYRGLKKEERELGSIDYTGYREREAEGEALVGRIESYNPSTRIAEIFIIYGFLQANDRIHVWGERTDFYQNARDLIFEGVSTAKVFAGSTASLKMEHRVEVGDLVYVVCKKYGILPLFLTNPCGIAAVVAGAGFLTLGAVQLTGEPTVSPFYPSRRR